MGDWIPSALAGTAFGSQVLRGESNVVDLKAESAASKYNAALAEQTAYREGAVRRRAARRYLAARVSASAKSGFALEGTPLAALIADAEQLEREALDAELAGRSTAKLERKRSATMREQIRPTRLGSVLSGAAGAGSIFYPLSRPWQY